MLLSEFQILLFFIAVGLALGMGIYLHFVKKNTRLALAVLIVLGFVIRLFMASVDPFLQNWDERFHALVAKNMMTQPFKPMLRIESIIPFELDQWWNSHVWVHKQPLFLWFMALSMKVLGISAFAVRVPSVIMGTLSIYFIYEIARLWLKNIDIAFVAALLFGFSYYQLELTSGRLSLDHNDLSFAFFVTASIWCFCKYLTSSRSLKWSILVGVMVGCAILIKWLTGLLIIGAWGLYLLLSKTDRLNPKKWVHLAVSALTSLVVFLPWQLYIMKVFPKESAVMYAHNRLHITKVLEGHSGTIWYHLNQVGLLYGDTIIVFILLGLAFLYSRFKDQRIQSASLLAMILVIYAFFSILVKTKMPAFTFPVHAVIWIIAATGIVSIRDKFFPKASSIYTLLLIFIIALVTLKPWTISQKRSSENAQRNNKIHNTKIYKSIDLSGNLEDRVILNVKKLGDVELMFYQDVTAYERYPSPEVLDSLIHRGYKFASFDTSEDWPIREYVLENKDVLILDEKLK